MARFRDELADSEHDLADLAELADALYDSDAFEADLKASIRAVLTDHAHGMHDVDLDTLAEVVFEEQLFKNGTGGLFMLRGDLVTNAEADIQEGDVIRMRSAQDSEKTLHYVISSADPERTRSSAIKVDVEAGETSFKTGGFQAGHIRHDERYEVARSFRDRDERPWMLARSLLEELQPQEADR